MAENFFKKVLSGSHKSMLEDSPYRPFQDFSSDLSHPLNCPQIRI